MSEANPFRPDTESPEVFVAQVTQPPGARRPQHDSKTALYWIIGLVAVGGIVVVGFAALLGGLVWYEVKRARDFVEIDGTLDDSDWEAAEFTVPAPPVRRPQSFASVFGSGPEASISEHPDYESIRRLAFRLAQVPQERVTPQLLQLIDLDRFTEAIKQEYTDSLGGDAEDVDWEEQRELLHSKLAGPIPFQKFLIFRIESPSDHERLVWVHVWKSGQPVRPVAWYLERSGESWRLFDWYPIDSGMKKSTKLAAVLQIDDPRVRNDYHRYVQLSDRYVQLIRSDDSNATDQVAQVLNECEQLTYPRPLFGRLIYVVAQRWYLADELDRAEELLMRAASWSRHTPGMYRLRGRILMRRGQYAGAIKAFQAYMEYAGPTASTLRWVATCQQALGENQAALATRRQLLVFERDPEATTLFDVATQLDDAAAQSVIEQVALSVDSELVLRSFVAQLGRESLTTRELEMAQPILEDRYPSAPATLACNAILDWTEGRFEPAIAGLAQAVRASIPADRDSEADASGNDAAPSADNPAEETVVSLAIDLARRCDRVVELCNLCGDRPAVHRAVLAAFDEDEDWVTPQLALECADLWLKTAPDDNDALRMKGIALARLGRWEEALAVLEPLTARLKPGTEGRVSALYALARCYCVLGSHDQLARLVAQDIDLADLFWILEEKNDIQGITRLAQQLPADGLERLFCQAWLDIHEGRFEHGLSTCVDLLQRDDVANIRSELLRLLMPTANNQGKLWELLESPAGPEIGGALEAFFRRTGDWKRAEQLVVHLKERPLPKRRNGRRSVTWQDAELNLLLAQHHYAKAVEMGLHWKSLAPQLHRLSDRDLEELVRCAILVGQFDDAERLVAQVRDTSQKQLLSTRIALHQGDQTRLERLYPRLSGRQKSELGRDMVLSRTPFTPKFYASAPYLSQFSRSPPLKAYLEAPVDLGKLFDADAMERVFGPNARTDLLEFDSKQQSVIGSVPPYRFAIRMGDVDDIHPLLIRNDIRQAVADASRVVSITVAMTDLPNRENDSSWKAFLLAKNLASHGLLGLDYKYAWVPASEVDRYESRVQLEQAAYWDSVAYYAPGMRRTKNDPLVALRRRLSVFRQFSQSSRAASPVGGGSGVTGDKGVAPPTVMVTAALKMGDVREPLRFRVLKIERWARYEPVVVAELLADAKSDSQLKAGQVLRILVSDITAVEPASHAL